MDTQYFIESEFKHQNFKIWEYDDGVENIWTLLEKTNSKIVKNHLLQMTFLKKISKIPNENNQLRSLTSLYLILNHSWAWFDDVLFMNSIRMDIKNDRHIPYI